jgi:ABC-2 type transport system ATP-binding protein
MQAEKTSGQICVSAQHVRKSYGNVVALKDVTLDLHRGEILALLGPNGAGKTTFVKILATALTKDGGHVKILGYDLDKQEGQIRRLFGYVGQDTDRSAYGRLTVIENLCFFGALRGLGKKQINERIDKLAADFGFEANLDKEFMRLSAGQRQIMVIMRALLHDPPLIYLDEPTKGLDPIVAKRIRFFLKQCVHQDGKSLLLTSHILSEVEQLADRIALIHEGEVGVIGSSDELKLAVGATEFVDLHKSTLPLATEEKILQLEPVLFSFERDPEWISFGVTDLLVGTEVIAHTLRQNGIQTILRNHTISLEDAFLHHIGMLTDKFD